MSSKKYKNKKNRRTVKNKNMNGGILSKFEYNYKQINQHQEYLNGSFKLKNGTIIKFIDWSHVFKHLDEFSDYTNDLKKSYNHLTFINSNAKSRILYSNLSKFTKFVQMKLNEMQLTYKDFLSLPLHLFDKVHYFELIKNGTCIWYITNDLNNSSLNANYIRLISIFPVDTMNHRLYKSEKF